MASKKTLLSLAVIVLSLLFVSGSVVSGEEIFSIKRGENVVLGSEIEGVFTVPLVVEGKVDRFTFLISYPESVIFVGLRPVARRWKVRNVARVGEEERGRIYLSFHRPGEIFLPFLPTVVAKFYFLPLLEQTSQIEIRWLSAIYEGRRVAEIRGPWVNLVFPPEE